jgi:hypothetical protein
VVSKQPLSSVWPRARRLGELVDLVPPALFLLRTFLSQRRLELADPSTAP